MSEWIKNAKNFVVVSTVVINNEVSAVQRAFPGNKHTHTLTHRLNTVIQIHHEG